MEAIFHVGMGKTGTSSIQQVLGANEEHLAKLGVQYLGLWFRILSPDFVGYGGQDRFFASGPEAMAQHAADFHRALKELAENTGNDRFIISNESIYGYPLQFAPFLAQLKQLCDVKVVIYARDPYSWLPSAYNQWALYHKTMPGRIPTYGEATTAMVSTYSGLRAWAREHRDLISLRHFRSGMDVVEDFSGLLDLFLPMPEKNTLERKDPAENALRAVFNGMREGQVLPTEFDRATANVDLVSSPDLAELAAGMFDYTKTQEIVDAHAPLFDEITQIFGIDIRKDARKTYHQPDVDALRHRALEHLLLLTMDQARRITELEQSVHGMRQELAQVRQQVGRTG
ncbi:polysaccharide biosynthesis protein [Poseidonocella sp. HB161398]|uniref:polysaccharide biosynthesis protein n=1 Tax=Poseidonocella sp. HB161398 TaxID=2320855 RepID=UPI001108D98E|nr:polysaccharide biosynthesis protein [Poseidonocella sp. HB161398]